MSIQYDLHSHSTASDGSLRPAELVRLAKLRNIDVLALTDHDNIDGIQEAWREAAKLDLQLVAGAEISVSWGRGKTIHIVGLNLDIDNPILLNGLQRLCEFRRWRSEEIDRRLAKKGIEGALQGARRFAKGNIIGRVHFARYLIEQGHAKDMKQVFKRYLVQGKPGYVPGNWATLEEALYWIQHAGGQAVIAHPARYRLSATRLRQLLGEFQELGGCALEVVSGSHSRDEIQRMAQLCSSSGLLASAGSDYHGPENPYMDMGQLPMMPTNCVPVWESPDWVSSTLTVLPDSSSLAL
ncbi:FIG00031715: Predicted metal-dependent phosphoesterases (PHP family) [hydrothermal vent metagenome]|uniref:FIG00031715: Predicted metal-dependent phosphoesterases (PHP family) n=1 Tax=hydrothermal vent metagenome TaxID=652676 RepID=A0A3B1C8K0_9ZZZZ